MKPERGEGFEKAADVWESWSKAGLGYHVPSMGPSPFRARDAARALGHDRGPNRGPSDAGYDPLPTYPAVVIFLAIAVMVISLPSCVAFMF